MPRTQTISDRESIEVGQKIKAWRFEKGLTQLSVANLLGVDVSTLAAWEKGRRLIPLSRINRVRNLVYRT
jgi:transcriptional regulator with XRE-family HTH domain